MEIVGIQIIMTIYVVVVRFLQDEIGRPTNSIFEI